MATTPSAQQLAIVNLYTALFNRAPDADGLNFWAQALANGVSLDTITKGFLGTPEATTLYPASQTAVQFVTAFYQTVFGRAPDTGGLAFWVDALNAAGGVDSSAAKALIVAEINAVVSTPLTTRPANLTDAEYAQALADRGIFANKVAVGVYFALETPGTDLNLARQALANVTADASSVDAGKLVAGGGGAPVGTTPRLIEGTDGDDVFDFVAGDVNAVDTIDGLGGEDTLNYVDASATGIAFPAATVKNVETINIRNVNTAGTVAEVAVLHVSFLPPGASLTVGGITVTAVGFADTPDIIDAIVNGRGNATVTVAGALTGYTAAAGEDSVTFTATVKGDVPDLVVTQSGDMGPKFALARIPGFEPEVTITQGQNGAPHTVAADRFESAKTFNAHTSSAAVAFTGLVQGQVIGMIGDGSMRTGSLSGSYADNVGSATVELSGGTNGGSVTLRGTELTSVFLNARGTTANKVDGVSLANDTMSLIVDAETDLDVAGISGTGLGEIFVRGSASRVSFGEIAAPSLTSVDATSLMGNLAITLGASPMASFTGGRGNDVVTIAANGVFAGALDGGGGDNTLAFLSGTSLIGGPTARFMNFQTVQFSAAADTIQTYDLTRLNGVASALQVKQSAGDVVLSNVTAGGGVTVVSDVTGSLSLQLADASGGNDAVSVELDNLDNQAQGSVFGVTVQALKAVGVETLTIHANGAVKEEGGHYGSHIVVNSDENTSLSRVVIDGSQALDYTTGFLENGVAMTIDGSAATGALKLVGQNATKRIDMNGGSAADTFYAGRAGGTIHGGGGGDDIMLSNGPNTVVYRDVSESLLDFSIRGGNPGAKMDVIAGFEAGIDKIDLTALQIDHTTGPAFFTRNYASTDDLLAATNGGAFFSEGGEQRVAVSANVGEFRYLLVDANQNGEFDADADLAIWFLINWGALQDGDLIFSHPQ